MEQRTPASIDAFTRAAVSVRKEITDGQTEPWTHSMLAAAAPSGVGLRISERMDAARATQRR
ncbi:hypothetical protein [Streptomyces chartreusis]|uniref:hypothetical protein n=1 Tax=Streptomyces chartreusis TaxID=1969 RepID=UPI0037F74F9C